MKRRLRALVLMNYVKIVVLFDNFALKFGNTYRIVLKWCDDNSVNR